MSNDYYNHGSVPINRSLAQSALIRTEFDAVTAGFAKLPTLSGNAYKPVIVNAAGDALGVAGWKVYGGFNDTSSVAVGTSALALANTGGIQNTAIGAYAMSAGVVSSFNNVAVGYQSLYSATTAQSNTAVGAVALKANTTGNGNTAIGNGAMFQSVSGNSNTAVGGGSMNDRTSGDGNVAVGSASLYANATGAGNTVVGYLACRYFTGSGITAIGYQACNATVTGTRNTAVGYEALLVDTGYGYNTAIGWNALKANTSGGANTAVGSQALGSNTTGDLNVAVGQTSMFNNTTGANNTAVGNAAMANNVSGSNNTTVGSAAGLNFSTTDNNTAIGVDSGLTAGTETNTTTIGYQAVATASNQVVIGNEDVTETILRGMVRSDGGFNYRGGDDASATNSAFGEGALDSNSGGTDNTAAGNNALTANSSASYNTAFGSGALVAVTTGPRNTAMGYRAGYAAGTGALENTFIGVSTGLDLAAANIQSCVMVGYAAGSGLTGGNENTFVGTQAGVNPGGSYSNVIAIGKSAEVTASNQTVIGNGSTTETILFGQVKGGAGTGTGQPVMVGTLSIQTTAVGNVGAGTDDLMTYTLPANSMSANTKGVRIKAWGTLANNANAKQILVLFGGTALVSPSVTVSNLSYWEYEAIVLRTGANAQMFQATFTNGRTTQLDFSRDKGTLTKTDTAGIIIKCTGTATADNDIVQEGMIVEFFN